MNTTQPCSGFHLASTEVRAIEDRKISSSKNERYTETGRFTRGIRRCIKGGSGRLTPKCHPGITVTIRSLS